jgi:hypothetical protein
VAFATARTAATAAEEEKERAAARAMSLEEREAFATEVARAGAARDAAATARAPVARALQEQEWALLEAGNEEATAKQAAHAAEINAAAAFREAAVAAKLAADTGSAKQIVAAGVAAAERRLADTDKNDREAQQAREDASAAAAAKANAAANAEAGAEAQAREAADALQSAEAAAVKVTEDNLAAAKHGGAGCPKVDPVLTALGFSAWLELKYDQLLKPCLQLQLAPLQRGKGDEDKH